MVHALRVSKLGHDVYLDNPTSGLLDTLGILNFSGWATADVISIQVKFHSHEISAEKKIRRPDVTDYLTRIAGSPGHDIHGFSFATEARPFEVFACFSDGRTEKQYVGDIGSPTNVSRGRSNWLFLNSSNGILEQADGTFDAAPAIAQWDNYLQNFDGLARELGANWCFSIAPSKELVVSDLSPFNVVKDNFLSKFLAGSRYRNFFSCPMSDLVRLRAVSYWPGDTHWSDVGAAIGVKDILKKFSIFDDIDPSSGINFVDQPGDLKAGLLGLHDAIYPELPYARTARLAFDNYMVAGGNTGRFMIWESDEDVANGTLFVSGGSSFHWMWKYITPWFKRTVFIHGTGRVDPQLLYEIAPTHIVLQNNSRFMSSHPDGGNFAALKNLLNPVHMSAAYACGYPYYDRIAAEVLGHSL